MVKPTKHYSRFKNLKNQMDQQRESTDSEEDADASAKLVISKLRSTVKLSTKKHLEPHPVESSTPTGFSRNELAKILLRKPTQKDKSRTELRRNNKPNHDLVELEDELNLKQKEVYKKIEQGKFSSGPLKSDSIFVYNFEEQKDAKVDNYKHDANQTKEKIKHKLQSQTLPVTCYIMSAPENPPNIRQEGPLGQKKSITPSSSDEESTTTTQDDNGNANEAKDTDNTEVQILTKPGSNVIEEILPPEAENNDEAETVFFSKLPEPKSKTSISKSQAKLIRKRKYFKNYIYEPNLNYNSEEEDDKRLAEFIRKANEKIKKEQEERLNNYKRMMAKPRSFVLIWDPDLDLTPHATQGEQEFCKCNKNNDSKLTMLYKNEKICKSDI